MDNDNEQKQETSSASAVDNSDDARDIELLICEAALEISDGNHSVTAYGALFFRGMLFNADISPLVRTADMTELIDITGLMYEEYHSDFIVAAVNYDWDIISDCGDSGLFQLIVYDCIATFVKELPEPIDNIVALIKHVRETLPRLAAAYTRAKYNPGLLNDKDVAVLPPLDAMGYYAGRNGGVGDMAYAEDYKFLFT